LRKRLHAARSSGLSSTIKMVRGVCAVMRLFSCR
jgi:hypothetical protein